jgi:trehalose 6-phosphate phosphatase
VFLDFDGTLAPIVEVPEEACPLPGAGALLGQLAERYRRVAVVSGRPLAFLLDRLGAEAGHAELVGLYGLERAAPSGTANDRRIAVEPAALRWQATVEAAATMAQAAAPPGLLVERKGLTVTLHYRQTPEHARWAAEFAAEQQSATGLIAHPGKQSWELRPPVPTDKGTVVAELADGLQAACFVGDDAGDVPAFAALARLRAQRVDTLAIAVGGPETPPEVLHAADLVVNGPAGVLDLLHVLAVGSG